MKPKCYRQGQSTPKHSSCSPTTLAEHHRCRYNTSLYKIFGSSHHLDRPVQPVCRKNPGRCSCIFFSGATLLLPAMLPLTRSLAGSSKASMKHKKHQPQHRRPSSTSTCSSRTTTSCWPTGMCLNHIFSHGSFVKISYLLSCSFLLLFDFFCKFHLAL